MTGNAPTEKPRRDRLTEVQVRVAYTLVFFGGLGSLGALMEYILWHPEAGAWAAWPLLAVIAGAGLRARAHTIGASISHRAALLAFGSPERPRSVP